MARKKKTYPSQGRYNAKNPTISFRVTMDEYRRIKDAAAKGDRKVGDIVRDAVLKSAKGARQSYTMGYNKGYRDAKKKYRVTYPCNRCGGLLELTSDDERRAVRKAMKGWHHSKCP